MPEKCAHEVVFSSVYDALSSVVAQTYSEKAMTFQVPVLEPAEVAGWSLLDIPRDRLLEIDGDDVFITALYTRLLNRLPSAEDISGWAAQLESGITRAEALDRFLTSDEFRRREVRVVIS